MKTFRLMYAFVLLLVFSLISSNLFGGSDASAFGILEDSEVFIKDAKQYASIHNVSLEEALYRLGLQDAIGKLDEDLLLNESGVYAGLWVQHQPEYRIIIQLSSNKENTILRYIDKSIVELIEVDFVPLTLVELLEVQNETLSSIRKLGILAESGLSIPKNKIELYILKRDSLSLANSNVEIPDSVQIIEVDELSTLTNEIFAGLALSFCTSGFSVQNGSGVKGITTAAHCNNTLSYNGSNLPFQGAAYGGQYDVQWHTAPNFTVRNLAYDGSAYRYIWGTKHRDNQYVGEWVCKYGKQTGYSCGSIMDKHFQPSPSDCSNCFTSTFIRVNTGSSGGDSGGPWMVGNTAYGITHGRIPSTGDSIYMAVNYVSFLGISILTN